MTEKVVFISGASRGIGQQTAYRFASAGYGIVIAYYNGRAEALNIENQCQKLGATDTLVINLDLTDDDSIRQVVSVTVKRFGKIAVLINNAGVLYNKPLNDSSFAEIDEQLTVNLTGMIKLTREFLPYLQESIINIGSRLGSVPKKNFSIYAASKFGARGFTRSLAKEFPQLRIFTVNPALTATKMTNFVGMNPSLAAEVIYKAATGRYRKPSGSEIDIWYYALDHKGRFIYLLKKVIKVLIGRRT